MTKQSKTTRRLLRSLLSPHALLGAWPHRKDIIMQNVVFMKRSKINIREEISPGDLIIQIALNFLSFPYKEGTLESPGKEKLVVNFRQFDCSTFVETILALAHCFIAGRTSKREFQRKLKFIRYRQGIIAGYSSRLHYFTDWLSDNGKEKIIKDISKRLGGKPRRKKIDFMTSHRDLYAPLKNKKEFQKMLIVERNISRRAFHVIGKDKIDAIKSKIQNGDIIAFAANQEGLDVAHTGFALWQGKHLSLLHASSKEGAVVISRKTLTAYLQSNKNFTGIVIARSS